jgi:hypothetical protein
VKSESSVGANQIGGGDLLPLRQILGFLPMVRHIRNSRVNIPGPFAAGDNPDESFSFGDFAIDDLIPEVVPGILRIPGAWHDQVLVLLESTITKGPRTAFS